MQEAKNKQHSKTPHKTTVPRRRLFFIEAIIKKTLTCVSVLINSWWSCGVPPPGPKGNESFLYKFSSSSSLTIRMTERQTEIP